MGEDCCDGTLSREDWRVKPGRGVEEDDGSAKLVLREEGDKEVSCRRKGVPRAAGSDWLGDAKVEG